MGFERVEDTLRLDSRTGLARLAEDTGGFLVEDANDLSAAFRRIDEDNQFHYLLTYAPSTRAFDGRFRTIRVKVRVPGLQVFARKGYRAMRTSRTADAGDLETPALALLDRAPLPNAFPIHAAGVQLSRPGASWPGAAAGACPDGGARASTSIASAPATPGRRRSWCGFATQRARRADAQPAVRADRRREGCRRPRARERSSSTASWNCRRACYTIESIVFDAVAQQGSARVATLTVPAGDARPGST